MEQQINDQFSNQPAPQLPKTKTVKMFWLIILLVLVVALVGVLLWQRSVASQINDGLQQKIIALQNQKNNKIIATTSDETANWKVYKNNNYVFEIKYPEGWVIKTDNMPYGYVSFEKNNLLQDKANYLISVSVSDNLKSISLRDFVLQGGGILEKDLSHTEVAGQQAVKFEVADGYRSGPDVVTVIAYGGKFYTLNYNGFAHPETHYKFIDAYNQMLSTFKFTK